jgi:hypothetical protein
MKLLITESKLFQTIEKLLVKKYPSLSEKLFQEKLKSLRNRGYGSGLDDYFIITTYYEDVDGERWFKRFSDDDMYEDSKWEVSDNLEFLYNIFGEEVFQSFIKHYFGIDLLEQGNKKYNWLFR